MRSDRSIPLAIALLALLVGGPSRSADGPVVPVQATAVAESGGRYTVLWRLEPTSGWHLYADLRNDAGYPPSVKLQLPAGWSAGPLQWPVPERSVAAGEILDHVYSGSVTLLQEVAVPAGALDGAPVAVGATWDWLACREMCVPGRTPVEVVFSAGSPTPQAVQAVARARADLPTAAPATGWHAVWSDAAVQLIVPGAARLEFYPATGCARLVDAIADGAVEGDRLTLRLRPGPDGFGPPARRAAPEARRRRRPQLDLRYPLRRLTDEDTDFRDPAGVGPGRRRDRRRTARRPGAPRSR